ncbi:hypothetical protein [Synoicihabitans lomoniglobus]|uniref:Peptidase S54 rhomboid domain-containing protein n=1 Tax=Synoicihabitans lomoniglobus TaxID=2909285 RepID=A0AAE9ZVJ9_9BACT|nr:derlin [Opitutaceae bacterium LMO-M01]WED64887.1 hypothetical protein PXH66_21280 [Opitutaceae bacterium LMO-M01]
MPSWINKIERRLEPLAINNITLYLVIAQTFVLLAGLMKRIDVMQLIFVPAWFLQGDWWRIFSFVAMPPGFGMLVAFALYLFYLYGNALEHYFGTLRYNLFLLTGYLLTVGLAFLSPGEPATNVFLGGSVFLAFAFLNPDFVLHLFFILPVKIKWIALVTWVFYGFNLVVGSMTERLAVLAATGNFLIFFGREIVQRIRTGRRAVTQQAKRAKLKQELGPMHKCSVCGRDSDAETELGFRYRTEGDKEVCYCEDHLPPRE